MFGEIRLSVGFSVVGGGGSLSVECTVAFRLRGRCLRLWGVLELGVGNLG